MGVPPCASTPRPNAAEATARRARWDVCMAVSPGGLRIGAGPTERRTGAAAEEVDLGPIAAHRLSVSLRLRGGGLCAAKAAEGAKVAARRGSAWKNPRP